eukprot:GHVT01061753.1.p2 GENE.GHVT01061753.1~~GHVT01061753.1.p2  ORF type:complete len:122 (+),score=25.12 GHVT01061753.1:140-505(+)
MRVRGRREDGKREGQATNILRKRGVGGQKDSEAARQRKGIKNAIGAVHSRAVDVNVCLLQVCSPRLTGCGWVSARTSAALRPSPSTSGSRDVTRTANFSTVPGAAAAVAAQATGRNRSSAA